ncbi:MAG: hypothetical protein WD757_06775 [Actinomycetota bacterium]
MRQGLRILLFTIVVIACGVVGFITGWKNFGSGGLQNYYRYGKIGLTCGLFIGLVLILKLRAIMRRRDPTDDEVRSTGDP